MIADYMEKGFLSNIIAMFKADTSLYDMIGELISDERLMVRVGITALMEEMRMVRPAEAKMAVPSLLSVLQHKNPTIRGDAAYLVGLVGDDKDREALKALLEDSNPQVVEIVEDILGEEKDEK